MEADSYREAMADVMATPQSVMGFALVALIMIVSMLSAVGAILSFFFTMTLFRVPEEHRKMALGRVWFIMIPFFGLYWMTVVIRRLAESFRSYFRALEEDEKPVPDVARGNLGVPMGLAMSGAAILAHLSALLVYTKSPVMIGVGLAVSAVLALVTGLLYFIQVFRVRRYIPDPGLEIVPESYL